MTALHRPARAAGLRARVRTGDPHLRLAVGLAVPAWLIPIVAGDSAASIGIGALYLLAQLLLGFSRTRRLLGTWQHLVRLVVAVAFVVTLAGVARGGLDRPFTALYLPIVVLAASIGLFEAVVIGILAVAAVLLPLLPSFDLAGIGAERALMMASACAVLTIGTRRTIDILERQGDRLRSVVRRDRRRARQIAGIEAVGDVLAAKGPTTESLDDVVSLLVSNFGYRYVSIFLREPGGLRLGAQRGHREPVEWIPDGRGVVGRVVASGELVFLPDVSVDRDYIASSVEVRSAICAPLFVDSRVFGVLKVEADIAGPLDQTDVATVRLVADRLAAAVALGAGRAALEARANSLGALIAFSRGLAETLEEEALYERIARSVGSVVPADIAIVTVRHGDRYVLSAQSGVAEAPWVGIEIRPGEGMAGRAIAARTIVSDDGYGPNDFPREAPRDAGTRTRMLAVAVPLIHDDEVVGAVSLFRYEVDRAFSELELETLGALGAHAAVAIINAQLHAEVAESAVRDPLTGLFNRRHFDAAVARLLAGRQRRGTEEPLAVVLFDLDQFGQVNKDHGHAFGDEVLRAFGALLTSRFRRSDLVARYGGEEFVAILEGSTGDEAKVVADEIRERFASLPLRGVTGQPLGQTVSAGVVGEAVGDVDPQAMFATVDVALSLAKRAGRNQVVRV